MSTSNLDSLSPEEKEKKQSFFKSFLSKFKKTKGKDKSKTKAEKKNTKRQSKSSTTSSVTSSSSKGSPMDAPPKPSALRSGKSEPMLSDSKSMRSGSTLSPPSSDGKRTSSTPLKCIKSGQVTKYAKDSAAKDYVFIISIQDETGKKYDVQKTFDQFYAFHSALIFQFPAEAGLRNQKRTLPDLPLQVMFVSESIAASRVKELNRYVRTLLIQSPKIVDSVLVKKFFMEVAAPSRPAGGKKGKGKPAVVGRPNVPTRK